MKLRKILAEHLTTLRWIDIPTSELQRVAWTDTKRETGWWRIVAEISCSSCGSFQGADSDPTNDKQVATTLALGLFHEAGWRVGENDRPVCGSCVQEYPVDH